MTAPGRAHRPGGTRAPALAVLIAAAAVLTACAGSPRPPVAAPGTSAAAAPSSAAPTPSPSPEDTRPAGRCLDDYPGQIPDAVFLVGSLTAEGLRENGICYRLAPPPPGEQEPPSWDSLPRVCPTGAHASDALIADRRGINRIWNSAPKPDEHWTVSYDHTVTRYDGRGAVDYLAELRAAVKRCGPYTEHGVRHDYAIVSGPKLGDESLRMTLHRRHLREPEGMPQEATYYISVVRRGAYVGVVVDHGWEGSPTHDAAIFDVMAQAAKRLPAA
ncbi:hypothetical protein CS0771_12600 [Catellatospora sp. IY07-71]|uniref:hypothetical protein n=1 Tax=Catellatospora sp. IY07-71 TaxID=2728827 RepID=UPI001BB3C259|nr:hypothetical protein [Catellatospora sp. IY07-71]BCJ71716.1 hypothetical protein CS0771_12600 [Catellatospora sp. IY07-71]